MPKEEVWIHELEMMAKNEDAVGELYGVYASTFPEHKELWESLMLEEANHAKWIRKFIVDVKDGLIVFNGGRFNVKAIEESIESLREAAIKARRGAVGIHQALMTAFELEDSLIEEKWLDAVKTDSDEMQKLLELLHSGTNEHRARIEAALEKENTL